MRAFYNMQSNCTMLNECVSQNYNDFQQDFCKLTTFTAQDLSVAIRCSPYFGESGLISFNNRSIVRSSIPMNLFQVQNESNVVKIGQFANLSAIFYNNEYFPNDEIPISSKNSFNI